MHYEVKKTNYITCDDNYINPIAVFLNKEGLDTEDVFKFIDDMEENISKGNTFDTEYFKEAKDYIDNWKNEEDTYDAYRKFNYYIDKLQWLKVKNAKTSYYNERRKIENEIISNYPDLKYPILNLGVYSLGYRQVLRELYKEALLDIFRHFED
ncbi:MAG: hypothetical protein N4A48_14350 [Tepidibacter sp.]|jgi:hypothetical protein|uniref:hypothetical protein n=1 Tax=Tepidibacter sp. TaxID=2529387 RepID=UPI0025DFF030|nr:hypothetical protein [Tepidibacter sp.]MCT4509911.1 hypothetical protein [Tepidibacter sp.]